MILQAEDLGRIKGGILLTFRCQAKEWSYKLLDPNPDPHGSVFILLSWIRIFGVRIRIREHGNRPTFTNISELVFVNLERSPGIDSQPGGIDPWNRFLGSLNIYKFGLCAGFFEHSMVTKHRVGIVLSYRPARLPVLRLAESLSWNRFLGSFKV